MAALVDAVMAAHRAGVSVIPILADGTKRPPFKWSQYQIEQPTEQQVRDWFASGRYTGYALICGVVSNNLEVLDFDDRQTYQTFLDTAESLGLGPLVDRIRAGYEEFTPSGGVHIPYFCDTISGNQKLARRDDKEVLIETRGIGGYVIAAPSNGTVHPSGGAWVLSSGGPDTIADITPEERESLLTLARSFDQIEPEIIETYTEPSGSPETGRRPGDEFRRKHESLHAFRDIVEKHGWKLTHTRGSVGYFRRPGKDDGWSATYNHADSKLFYVFSSSTDFEPERGYNPFSVYAILNHNGNYADAATELARQGYGSKGPILGTITVTKRRDHADKPMAAFEPHPMPDNTITGWFREYVDLMSPTAESSEAFHMAVAVTFVGSCIGKRIGFHHASDKLYPNFYTLLIGPTGSARKDTAIRRMIDAFYAPPPRGYPLVITESPFRIARDISSSEGLIAMLRKKSNILLYAAEFSKVMSNAERESTKSIGPTLIEAFDTPPSMQNNTKANAESSEPMEARNPFVSVITSVQPEKMAEIVSGDHQYSGFLNRWWLIQGKGTGPRPNPPFVDEQVSYNLIRRMFKTINEYEDGTLLKMDGDAMDLWSEWYVASYPTGNETSQEDAMGVRRGTIVKKIALVHAVMDSAKFIGEEHIRIGIALSDWAWEGTRRLLPTWGESKDAELARKITEKLDQRGPMTKRQLQQLTGSRLGPGVFARIIKSMVENGEIVTSDNNIVAIAPDL